MLLFVFAVLVTLPAVKPVTVGEFLARPKSKDAEKLTGEALVDYVNKQQSFFKVEYSPNAEKFMKARIMDAKFLDDPELVDAKVVTHSDLNIDLPKRCGGGWVGRALGFAWRYGFCTGGPYREKNVCQPYPFYPCGYHKNQTYHGPCAEKLWPTPKCRKTCQLGYPVPFGKDKIYKASSSIVIGAIGNYRKWTTFASTWAITTSDRHKSNGPIYDNIRLFPYSNCSRMFVDWLESHKLGLQYTAGRMTGSHAVKNIGWGEEGDLPYWLVANSWNTDWGENGYFRIIRGDDHCGIKSKVVVGVPRM